MEKHPPSMEKLRSSGLVPPAAAPAHGPSRWRLAVAEALEGFPFAESLPGAMAGGDWAGDDGGEPCCSLLVWSAALIQQPKK